MDRDFRKSRYIGYQQITSLSSATQLTVPEGTLYALITPDIQPVRWLGSAGGTLSATVGYPLPVGAELEIDAAELANFRFIEQAAGAKLNIVYFGRSNTP